MPDAGRGLWLRPVFLCAQMPRIPTPTRRGIIPAMAHDPLIKQRLFADCILATIGRAGYSWGVANAGGVFIADASRNGERWVVRGDNRLAAVLVLAVKLGVDVVGAESEAEGMVRG